ncbi:MAG: hypothetical protein KGL39_39865 [Patescibacteria group bacterium]|nr:hypothetical protein [Patescibacteria group bacterium]
MNEMVERVAHAMEPHLWDKEATNRMENGGWGRELTTMQLLCVSRAHKAIEALREPTWAMREALRQRFADLWLKGPHYTPTVEELDAFWRSGINEALK